jgi:hypothetical protein
MQLRREITEIIEESCPGIHDGDTDRAAKRILKCLNNYTDLKGNGWFDDDRDMLAFLDE